MRRREMGRSKGREERSECMRGGRRRTRAVRGGDGMMARVWGQRDNKLDVKVNKGSGVIRQDKRTIRLSSPPFPLSSYHLFVSLN